MKELDINMKSFKESDKWADDVILIIRRILLPMQIVWVRTAMLALITNHNRDGRMGKAG
jgi:hypothetical protein